MNKILIEITGTQRVDNQKSKMELTTVGTIEETADTYIVNYTEEQEPPVEPVKVCVKIQKDEKRVEMIRSGPFDSCLIIEKSKRNLCPYGTEYGDILMGISGHTIDSEYSHDNGNFLFSYDIDINGALVSRNEVKMRLKNQNTE